MDRSPISGDLLKSRRICFSVLLFLFLTFLGARQSSGQDLGALARQEQARKEAHPVHANHVYTNDDLQRPRILVPDDSLATETARNKIISVAPSQPPAVEAGVPEVSLGEVARKYQKQKLAHEEHAPEAQPAVAAHVYSNDDLVRDKILTPEDTAVYKAALEKPVPALGETAAEKTPDVVAAAETPLGDLARVAYQRAKQEVEVQVASTFQIPQEWASLKLHVYRKHSARSTQRMARLARATAPHRMQPRTPELRQEARKFGFEVVTVRSGDSLWKLARRHLGHGVRWRALLAANPEIRNPFQLKVGATIRV